MKVVNFKTVGHHEHAENEEGPRKQSFIAELCGTFRFPNYCSPETTGQIKTDIDADGWSLER